ncbi:hypothetical protein [Agromyces badenianii]|uniref:hypothetical protein n=1 Tax=Agromyces badenianii TaxID=2080742 RepID=UPI000D5A1049|nr:hypothetical protein [Agromyces badenianii]PWC03210.1 hypothetical protein DCE94_13210 [Agromyces badenianii]
MVRPIETQNFEVIRGPSAREWATPLGRLSWSLLGLTAATVVAYFASGATAATVPVWVYALIALTLLDYVAVLFLVFAALTAAMRESKRGYSTMAGFHHELPLLNPRTAEVLKTPGERQAEIGRSGNTR